jgi:hypothetical protein
LVVKSLFVLNDSNRYLEKFVEAESTKFSLHYAKYFTFDNDHDEQSNGGARTWSEPTLNRNPGSAAGKKAYINRSMSTKYPKSRLDDSVAVHL